MRSGKVFKDFLHGSSKFDNAVRVWGKTRKLPEQPETEQTEQSETEDTTGDKTEDTTIDKTDGKAEGNEAQNITEEEIDFSNAFQGINGCAVLSSPSENRYSFYNQGPSEQEASPLFNVPDCFSVNGIT